MKRKAYLIIGLGEFGRSLVESLAAIGADLIVVDKYEDKLNDISHLVTEAICADASDPDVLEQLDMSQIDAAIVTTGSNLTVGIITTVLLKEYGVPYVVVKANNDLQGKALKKVGADKVVFPEKEIGVRMANRLFYGDYLDAIELSEDYSIVDAVPKSAWIGHTIANLDVRKNHKINIIGIRKGKDFLINPAADYVLEDGDVLVVLGNNIHIRDFKQNMNN